MLPVGGLFAFGGVYAGTQPEALALLADILEVALIGGLLAVLGVLAFVIAYGLFRLRPWGWLMAMALQGLNLGISLWARFAETPEYISMALSVFIVLALNQAEVRNAFQPKRAIDD